jgi:hypothetical protein
MNAQHLDQKIREGLKAAAYLRISGNRVTAGPADPTHPGQLSVDEESRIVAEVDLLRVKAQDRNISARERGVITAKMRDLRARITKPDLAPYPVRAR